MALAFRLPRVAPASGERTPLRLVEPVRRRSHGAMAAAALVIGCMFAVAVLQSDMAEQQVRIDRLSRDIIRARNNFDRLRAERARYQSPEYLSGRARELGLVPGLQTAMVAIPTDIAVEVASGIGKVDSDVVAANQSPLDQFGRMKRTVQGAP